MTFLLSLIGNRFGQLGLVFLAGYFFAVYQIPRVDVKAIERNAIEARDSYWQRQMAQLQTNTERAISDILSTVDQNGDTSENVAEYCKSNPGLCRGGGEK